MIISIQQPEFFPWCGFLLKIRDVDETVILDNVQFKKRYYENRCAIKVQAKKKLLTVPVKTKGKYKQKICEVFVDNSSNWGKICFNTLSSNYSKAPFWKDHEEFLMEIFLKRKWHRLLELSMYSIKYFCEYLGIPFVYVLASELKPEGTGSDLILEICRLMKATKYLSGQFGKTYLNEKSFQTEGISIIYQNYKEKPYPQFNEPFVSPLSGLDLILNVGKKGKAYL